MPMATGSHNSRFARGGPRPMAGVRAFSSSRCGRDRTYRIVIRRDERHHSVSGGRDVAKQKAQASSLATAS